jgi:hypothetical protein
MIILWVCRVSGNAPLSRRFTKGELAVLCDAVSIEDKHGWVWRLFNGRISFPVPLPTVLQPRRI